MSTPIKNKTPYTESASNRFKAKAHTTTHHPRFYSRGPSSPSFSFGRPTRYKIDALLQDIAQTREKKRKKKETRTLGENKYIGDDGIDGNQPRANRPTTAAAYRARPFCARHRRPGNVAAGPGVGPDCHASPLRPLRPVRRVARLAPYRRAIVACIDAGPTRSMGRFTCRACGGLPRRCCPLDDRVCPVHRGRYCTSRRRRQKSILCGQHRRAASSHR